MCPWHEARAAVATYVAFGERRAVVDHEGTVHTDRGPGWLCEQGTNRRWTPGDAPEFPLLDLILPGGLGANWRNLGRCTVTPMRDVESARRYLAARTIQELP